MERTFIRDIRTKCGETAKVSGFVENIRDGKSMAFIVIKDITGKLQITVEKEKCPALVDDIARITPDSVISCTGFVAENEYVKMGGIELLPTELEIESVADALPIIRKEIPATKKKQAVERSAIDQRLNYRWIDLRTDENQLLFKVQSCLVNAMREYLLKKDFIEIHTPKLIGARMFLKLNILTARRILPRVRSSTSRWQWRRVLNVYLKSVPFSVRKNLSQASTQPNLRALTLNSAISNPTAMLCRLRPKY